MVEVSIVEAQKLTHLFMPEDGATFIVTGTNPVQIIGNLVEISQEESDEDMEDQDYYRYMKLLQPDDFISNRQLSMDDEDESSEDEDYVPEEEESSEDEESIQEDKENQLPSHFQLMTELDEDEDSSDDEDYSPNDGYSDSSEDERITLEELDNSDNELEQANSSTTRVQFVNLPPISDSDDEDDEDDAIVEDYDDNNSDDEELTVTGEPRYANYLSDLLGPDLPDEDEDDDFSSYEQNADAYGTLAFRDPRDNQFLGGFELRHFNLAPNFPGFEKVNLREQEETEEDTYLQVSNKERKRADEEAKKAV
ncbi:hypothetical protein CU097_012492 [Rhizopus azygosporus]|uniref:Uncharacterized protein n=1 Tax=Rhizopus azygosporus TaxID=86630 RepID=A0A367KFC8_RHIAZ|nr:hypothetical protein CU097_012492 [Rhizopus azygosporus]